MDPLVERGEIETVLTNERRCAQPAAVILGEELLALCGGVASSSPRLRSSHVGRLPHRHTPGEDVLRLPLTLDSHVQITVHADGSKPNVNLHFDSTGTVTVKRH